MRLKQAAEARFLKTFGILSGTRSTRSLLKPPSGSSTVISRGGRRTEFLPVSFREKIRPRLL